MDTSSANEKSREGGQAMTEYIILVLVISVGLLPFYKLIPVAVAGYLRPFYYCISRSIP